MQQRHSEESRFKYIRENSSELWEAAVLGKTTLLNCIASVLRPTTGRILLKGQDIGMYTDAQLAAYRGRQIGYLFQQFELLDNLTGGENILLPAQIHKIAGKGKAEKGCRS